jgi:uncharacterized membrane protein
LFRRNYTAPKMPAYEKLKKNEDLENELERIMEMGRKEKWQREIEKKDFITEREILIEEVYPQYFTVNLVVG